MSLLSTIRSGLPQPMPGNLQSIRTVDLHTAGEPLRVVLDQVSVLAGAENVLECRRILAARHDGLRKVLIQEPRGHADMYGSVLVPPNDAEADLGVVFLHNDGYSTMCGHAVIAISTLVFRMGWKTPVEGSNVLRLDTPCGRIESWATFHNGSLTGVRFRNVPSFVTALDQTVVVPGLGEVLLDVAYGGAFYAVVDLRKNDLGFQLTGRHTRSMIEAGRAIKQRVSESGIVISHPQEPELGFLYGTIFVGDAEQPHNHSRNVCVFADGQVDRSPTGSGMSARLAIHHARDEIAAGRTITVESILGTEFSGRVVEPGSCGSRHAVIPEIAGQAFLTGQHCFLVEPEDPLQNGFRLP